MNTEVRMWKQLHKNKTWNLSICYKLNQILVRERGLEPPRA